MNKFHETNQGVVKRKQRARVWPGINSNEGTENTVKTVKKLIKKNTEIKTKTPTWPC